MHNFYCIFMSHFTHTEIKNNRDSYVYVMCSSTSSTMIFAFRETNHVNIHKFETIEGLWLLKNHKNNKI